MVSSFVLSLWIESGEHPPSFFFRHVVIIKGPVEVANLFVHVDVLEFIGMDQFRNPENLQSLLTAVTAPQKRS